MWNYESPTCTNGIDFTPPSTFGATVIANNSASDFALLQLDETPFDLTPPLCLYYNGWDRSGSTSSNTTCIHHPSGDFKKISIDNNSPSSNGNYWRVNDWDTGTTEGGSSGSPLFNPNQRIIGQLYGGLAACGNDLYDDFGKFSVSWNNSTDQKRKLRNWLDPIGTNPNTIDGAYLFPTNYSNISGSDLVCSSGASFTINNPPDGSTISWSQSSNLSRSSAQGSDPCTFVATYSGAGWIEATITTNCGNITLPRKTVWAGLPVILASNVIFTNCDGGSGYICTDCHGNELELPSGEYDYAEVKLTNLAGTITYDQFTCYSQTEDLDWGQYSDGTYKFWVRAHNDCGWGSWSSTDLDIVDCDRMRSSYYLEFTPNPVITETTVELKRYDKEKVEETIEWEFEVFDMSQIKKLKTYKFFSKKKKINTNGWKDGIYIVRAIVNDEMVTGKFIVKK